DLLEINARITEAGQLLEHYPDPSRFHRAVGRLASVDALLAELVVDVTVPDRVAARLGRVRDDLGSHVDVALDLDEIIVDGPAASLLLRGVTDAQIQIRSLANEHME